MQASEVLRHSQTSVLCSSFVSVAGRDEERRLGWEALSKACQRTVQAEWVRLLGFD
jgi:hypothetical protein